jgi:16S rRNA (cytosine967-C5)-methyltransferase
MAVEEGAHAEDVLADVAPQHDADRGLAWHLTLGVLRRRGEVDAMLRTALRQPLGELDPEVRAALRIGAFERMFSRTPAHAAVDQAVEVAVALGAGRARGLVNAVMRRAKVPEAHTPADALNHPAWLIQRWTERYGEEATRRWCEANSTPPPLVIATKDPEGAWTQAMVDEGVSLHPVTVGDVALDNAFRLEGATGRVDQLPGFEEGAWWVQDAASIFMSDLVPAGAGRVLDACAAPGGKSFRLAARGATVFAADVSERRLEKMGQSVRRLGLSVRYRQHDWTISSLDDASDFDAVIVDAPCTGLGVVRRHPEIRWRRGPFDPAGAAERQRLILKRSACHVRPGGVLVYVVCSPEPEEGAEVVDWFVKHHPEFTVEETRYTAPPTADEDAFYGVRMRRA